MDVRATTQYAGGVVGVSVGGSVTENVLATGAVIASTASAGGVAAYGYTDTQVRHTVALNSNIAASSYAHAIVGRVYSGQVATLEDNHVARWVPVSGQTLTDPPAADNQKGNVVAPAEIQRQAFYEARGWDFTTVWQWDDVAKRPTLRMAPEALDPAPVPDLPTDGHGLYIVDSVEDLTVMGRHPSYDYVLAADLDLTGKPFTSLPQPFTGEFDGAGHTIKGLTSTSGGLFAQISGHVHDLAILGAQVNTTTANVGILANAGTGTIERVWVSGSVTAGSRVGGLVGNSQGVVRDAYSTADVHSLATEAGGVIGVALAGSVTERVFATGSVRADSRNDGGVAGYGYTGTTIRDSIALNPTVTAPSFAHRFLGRVLAGNAPTLGNNWAVETLKADVQTETATGPATLNGDTASQDETADQAFWSGKLGFDLESVWQWDADGKRPVLRSVPEDVPAGEEPPASPALERADDGFYLLREPGHLAQLAAFPSERFRLDADLDLTGVARIAPAFTGELDGAGHTLTGYASADGGLFASVTGRVHDLTLTNASVRTAKASVGLLADRLDGTVERVATGGAIVGDNTVGGIVGYSCGVLRDAWSAAEHLDRRRAVRRRPRRHHRRRHPVRRDHRRQPDRARLRGRPGQGHRQPERGRHQRLRVHRHHRTRQRGAQSDGDRDRVGPSDRRPHARRRRPGRREQPRLRTRGRGNAEHRGHRTRRASTAPPSPLPRPPIRPRTRHSGGTWRRSGSGTPASAEPVLRGPAASPRPWARRFRLRGPFGRNRASIRREAVANSDGSVTMRGVRRERRSRTGSCRFPPAVGGRASTSAPDEDDIAYLGEVRLEDRATPR